MRCPICGAKCRCRNRGEGGLCCSCHRHKPSKHMRAEFLTQLEGLAPSEIPTKIRELHQSKQAEYVDQRTLWA